MRRIVLSVAIVAALVVVFGSLDSAEAGRRRCATCGPCAGGSCTVAIVPSAPTNETVKQEAPGPASEATVDAKVDEAQPVTDADTTYRPRYRFALFRRYRG
jgi:hypothetical protein